MLDVTIVNKRDTMLGTAPIHASRERVTRAGIGIYLRDFNRTQVTMVGVLTNRLMEISAWVTLLITMGMILGDNNSEMSMLLRQAS